MISWPAAYGIRCVKPSRAMVSPSRTNSAMASLKGSILANGDLLRRRHYYSVARSSVVENVRQRGTERFSTGGHGHEVRSWMGFICRFALCRLCGNRIGVAPVTMRRRFSERTRPRRNSALTVRTLALGFEAHQYFFALLRA